LEKDELEGFVGVGVFIIFGEEIVVLLRLQEAIVLGLGKRRKASLVVLHYEKNYIFGAFVFFLNKLLTDGKQIPKFMKG